MEVPTYKISTIRRKGGNTAEDNEREGKRVNGPLIMVGASAVLSYKGGVDRAIWTTKVIKKTEYINGVIEFETENTTYTLRKVE